MHATSAAAPTGDAGAGQIVWRCLLARRAGVHVDFHAHRHFDDFRSLPGHSRGLPLVWRGAHAEIERRASSKAAQVWNDDEPSSVWLVRHPILLSRTRSLLSWTKHCAIHKSIEDLIRLPCAERCRYFNNRHSAFPARVFSSLASSVPSRSGLAALKRRSTTATYSSAVSVPS